jgi:hypothetical protein
MDMDYAKYDEVIQGNNRYANLQNFKGNKKAHRPAKSFEDKVKIVALAEIGVDKDELAKSEGVTKQTVYNLIESLKKAKNLTQQQKQFLDRWEEKKLEMSDDMVALSEYIYKNITFKDIEKCSLPQKVTSMAILQDKALLMRGEATSRVAFDGISDEDLGKIIKGESIEAEVVRQNP